MRKIEGQLAFDLFREERKTRTLEDYREFCIGWLCKYYGCKREKITPIVVRLYEEFKQWEAFDRAKVIKACHGKHKVHGWSLQDAIDVCGIFDHSIDYHTCWDRAHAGRNGFTKEEAANVIEWDYHKKEPRIVRRKQDDEREIRASESFAVLADEDQEASLTDGA